MPYRSSSLAGATYLNKAQRMEDLRRMATAAHDRLPGICRVILFGSHAQGKATPRSDADILVVVECSAHENPRDRVPEMLKALAPLPCPIDLFILTSEEFERGRSQGSPLVRTAITTGIELL